MIVESSNDAIITTTPTGTITSWNREATRVFGYDPDEAIGRPVSMLSPPEIARDTTPRKHTEVARLEVMLRTCSHSPCRMPWSKIFTSCTAISNESPESPGGCCPLRDNRRTRQRPST